MKLLKSCATFCVNLLVKSQLKLIMSLKHLKRFGNYVLGRQIGKGGFGVVFKANHIKTGSTVAMKVIDLSKADPFVYKSTYREVYLLANLKSPNIVRIFEVASSKRFFCIFMEYIHGLTLLEDLNMKKHYDENIAKEIAKQIADALHYLHGKRVIHRDLKLENVMKRHLQENKRPQVVLIDFGFAVAWYPGCIMHTHCGSPEFAAPEIFEDDRRYGASVDIWSFGVVMYSMMVGRLPFQGKNNKETMTLVLGGFNDHHLTNLKMRGISIFGRRMVARCLEVNSKQRITIKQIIENSWFFNVEQIGQTNTSPKSFKDEVLQKMSEEYLPSQSTLAIESAIKKRPYGRVAGLYRLLNLQVEQSRRPKDDTDDTENATAVKTKTEEDGDDDESQFVRPTMLKKKLVRFDIV